MEPESVTTAPAPVIDVPVEMRGEDIFIHAGNPPLSHPWPE